MDLERLRRLVELMEEKGLVELEIEDEAGKVRLVRGRASEGGAPARRGVLDDAAGLGESADLPMGGAPTVTVTSPIVGTFYRAASPGAAPFVSEGDVVEIGQVLCLIEAMKMMNEIIAEVAGRVVAIPAENGAPVEYGSPLFLLAPVD
jgi:acetyl-CoA carboxylase biotin carboxyl carrier protein